MIIESKVASVLRSKRDLNVYTVNADDTVYDALEVMARHNLGAVLVLEKDKIVGILGERDYARRVALSGRSSKGTLVREIMEKRVLYVLPEDPIEGCLALMTEKRIRHLPVVESEKVIGIISIGDVVRWVISDQEYLISELVRYITGAHLNHSDPYSPMMKSKVEEREGLELRM